MLPVNLHWTALSQAVSPPKKHFCNLLVESKFFKLSVAVKIFFFFLADIPGPIFPVLSRRKQNVAPCQIDSFPGVVEAHLKHS